MEVFPALFIFAMIIFGIVNTVNEQKRKEAKAAYQRRRQAQPVRTAQGQQNPAAAAPTAAPAAQAVSSAAYEVVKPTITPSLHNHSEMFAGSMGDQETEGFDPHDHGFEAEVETPSMHSERDINVSLLTEETPKAAAPLLNWSGSALVQAFVMQEVLKRPAERRRV